MSLLTNNKVAYGKSQGLIDIFNQPIVSLRSPTPNDKGSKGQLWTNTTTNQVWMLTSYISGGAFWSELDNNGSTSGITWITTAAAAIPMANNTGYFLTNGGAVTLTLPLASPAGSQFYVNALGNTTWTIQANPGQTVNFVGISTTLGGTVSTAPAHFGVSAHLITTILTTNFGILDTNDSLLLA